jgi:hypothetical protein
MQNIDLITFILKQNAIFPPKIAKKVIITLTPKRRKYAILQQLVVKCSKRLFMRFFIGPGGATEWS